MEYKKLKGDYEKFAKKYKLPSFEKINLYFEVDKINYESEYFLRVVKKAMLEKVFNFISFLDMLLNPLTAPRMYLPYIKQMSTEDKELISKLYDKFSHLAMSSLVLEAEYNEKKEAEFINKIYETWKELSPEIRKLMESVEKPVEISVKKEKSYFG